MPKVDFKQRGCKMKTVEGRHGCVCIGALILVLMSGCASGDREQKAETRSLKAGYMPIAANLPLFVALDNGYFEKRGVTVQAIEATSPNDILSGIVSGQLDFAAVLAYTLLLPGASRYPGEYKLFSSGEETEAQFTASIITLADSPINTATDLKGKRIGVYSGIVQVNFLKAILLGLDMDPSEVEIVEISPRLQLQGLVSGQYDALSSIEPTVNIAKAQGVVKVIVENPRTRYILNPFPSFATTVSTRLLEEDPEAARAIVEGLEEAIDYIRANPEESKKVLGKYTPIPAAYEAEVLADLRMYRYSKLGEEHRENVQRFADFMYKNGLMESPIVDVDVLFADAERSRWRSDTEEK